MTRLSAWDEEQNPLTDFNLDWLVSERLSFKNSDSCKAFCIGTRINPGCSEAESKCFQDYSYLILFICPIDQLCSYISALCAESKIMAFRYSPNSVHCSNPACKQLPCLISSLPKCQDELCKCFVIFIQSSWL